MHAGAMPVRQPNQRLLTQLLLEIVAQIPRKIAHFIAEVGAEFAAAFCQPSAVPCAGALTTGLFDPAEGERRWHYWWRALCAHVVSVWGPTALRRAGARALQCMHASIIAL